MIRGLYTAATGLNAQQLEIDVIANNIANVNTTGFKQSRTNFQDLLYQALVEPGAATSATTQNPTGIQVGLGVRPASVEKIFTQGDLTSTGNQLDMAIEGQGFFAVTQPDGTTAYTRSGSFKLDSTGQIVTSDGYLLQPGFTIPETAQSISIGQDGTVTYTEAGNPTPSTLGQISLTRFPNEAGLRAAGRNLFEETESSGSPTSGIGGTDGFGRIAQGSLETSNVRIVDEVVKMILANRSYDANSKAVQAADEILSQSINLKR